MSKYSLYPLIALTAHSENDFQRFLQAIYKVIHDLTQKIYPLRYRLLYQLVLEDAGFECIPYTDSVKALKEFRPYYYDLILLDIKMPILNGFELRKKIREVDNTVHIIFITASELFYENIREKRYPELVNNSINYIQKPIANEELIQIINTTIAASDASHLSI